MRDGKARGRKRKEFRRGRREMQKAEGQRRLVREGEKACEGKERKVSRAVGVKFLWKENTLSMSVILQA